VYQSTRSSQDVPCVDVLTVPTAGLATDDNAVILAQPKLSGICRIEKAHELLVRWRTRRVVYLGGDRESGPSEASVYYHEHLTRFPDDVASVFMIVASEVCTTRDYMAGKQPLIGHLKARNTDELKGTIGATSYPEHLTLIKRVLKSLGFPNFVGFDSGETEKHAARDLVIMDIVGAVDPQWRWLGLPLVQRAESRRKLVVGSKLPQVEK
jgi:hypothetical protein